MSATTPGSREPPKDCASPGLDKHRLGELIDLIGTIGFGDTAIDPKDILGRVYEYLLQFFAALASPMVWPRPLAVFISKTISERSQGSAPVRQIRCCRGAR